MQKCPKRVNHSMSSKREWSFNDFEVKLLDDPVDLSGFKCDDDDELGLDNFLRKDAVAFYRCGLGVTHLFYLRGTKQFVGYVTLAMGAMRKNKCNAGVADYDKVNVPALFLGRLAVANGFRRAGIGVIIVKYCIDLAIVLSKSVVGCRFVTLVTKEGYRVKFYEKKCHFERVKASYLEPDCVLMRFNLYA